MAHYLIETLISIKFLTSSILGILVIVLYFYLKALRSSRKYPPGPPILPLVGNALSLNPNRFIAYNKIGKEYGDVFTIQPFLNKFVVLNSIKAIREALLEKGKFFLLRQHFKNQKVTTGIINSEGEHWQNHRRFALKTLRDFGFAKSLTVDAVQAELQSFMDVLNRQKGKPVRTKHHFAMMTTNVICRMVLGQRLSEDEKQCNALLSKMSFFLQTANFKRYQLLLIYPFLGKIPILPHVYYFFNKRIRIYVFINNYIRTIIRQHFDTIGEVSEPRDLTDALIMHKMALDEQNIEHTFNEDTMVADIFDLFVAGTDTTSVTLSWGILMMSLHKDIQERVRSEIHDLIGTDSPPTMQQKTKFNYTLAVIDEVSRYSSIVPFSLQHRTSEDVTICGKLIPEDTMIIPNLYAVHHDPALWKHPHTFNPENFLDEKGQYKPSDNLIQFSLGKRSCMGESLAKLELFIFFVGMMQKYKVSLADAQNVNLEKLLTGIDSIIRHLEDHEIVFEPCV